MGLDLETFAKMLRAVSLSDLERILTIAEGVSPSKKRRLALMGYLDRCSADGTLVKQTIAEILGGLEIVDEADVGAILPAWGHSKAGAKPGGVGKWVHLARIVKKWWDDDMKPESLRQEYIVEVVRPRAKAGKP